MSNIEVDYGIKYRVHKVNEHIYMLFPEELVEGYCSAKVFYAGNDLKALVHKADLDTEEIVVDDVYSEEELMIIYGMDDIGFIKEYFLEEAKDNVLIVKAEDGKLIKRKVPMKVLFSSNPKEELEKLKGEATVTLNRDALDHLLNMGDLEAVRVELKKYQNLIGNRSKNAFLKQSGTTSKFVSSLDGGADHDMKKFPGGQSMYQNNGGCSVTRGDREAVRGMDISLRGLETYIKERVFGHDDEIRKIAKTILMNYTAVEGEKNEPILLVGPTGTGKTETMKAIIEYLDIPLLEINSANLVPQGIKGMSIEDCLYSLIISAGYDVEKAQRGLVFFDEFDKLGETSSESKAAVVQILLKFIEGDTFMIDKTTNDYKFNTKMLMKIFAGAFSNLFVTKKTMGFGNDLATPPTFEPKMVTESQYFGKELVTRIPHIFVYRELSRELKRDVLLRSKLSEFLLKKERYQRQFGVELIGMDSYIDAILEKLESHENSMRDLNNLIIRSLDEAEYEMLSSKPGTYKKLVLTRDSVEDTKKIELI